MLRFMYGIQDEYPNNDHYSAANILHYLEIYRVAQKYCVPSLCDLSTRKLYWRLRNWLEVPKEGDLIGSKPPTPSAFCEVVAQIYKLTKADRKHALVQILFTMVGQRPMMKVLHNGAEAPVLLIQASQKVPEFGRDLF
jgi:hypothetical protein